MRKGFSALTVRSSRRRFMASCYLCRILLLSLRSHHVAARLNSGVRHVIKLSRQHEIWNRACLESGGATPAIGDSALASLLLAHGLATNGGVVHALECLSQTELSAAIAGFTYFGLNEAAQVFQQSPDNSEGSEDRLNQMYLAAIPSDEILTHAFRIKLVAAPEAFAPTGSGSHA
ncbi:MAG: hypothetical protein KGL91_04100 [Xanthomonadaceae bacterium]|nr:hypothetical protein [Xanthomonadaceae bacterium]